MRRRAFQLCAVIPGNGQHRWHGQNYAIVGKRMTEQGCLCIIQAAPRSLSSHGHDVDRVQKNNLVVVQDMVPGRVVILHEDAVNRIKQEYAARNVATVETSRQEGGAVIAKRGKGANTRRMCPHAGRTCFACPWIRLDHLATLDLKAQHGRKLASLLRLSRAAVSTATPDVPLGQQHIRHLEAIEVAQILQTGVGMTAQREVSFYFGSPSATSSTAQGDVAKRPSRLLGSLMQVPPCGSSNENGNDFLSPTTSSMRDCPVASVTMKRLIPALERWAASPSVSNALAAALHRVTMVECASSKSLHVVVEVVVPVGIDHIELWHSSGNNDQDSSAQEEHTQSLHSAERSLVHAITGIATLPSISNLAISTVTATSVCGRSPVAIQKPFHIKTRSTRRRTTSLLFPKLLRKGVDSLCDRDLLDVGVTEPITISLPFELSQRSTQSTDSFSIGLLPFCGSGMTTVDGLDANHPMTYTSQASYSVVQDLVLSMVMHLLPLWHQDENGEDAGSRVRFWPRNMIYSPTWNRIKFWAGTYGAKGDVLCVHIPALHSYSLADEHNKEGSGGQSPPAFLSLDSLQNELKRFLATRADGNVVASMVLIVEGYELTKWQDSVMLEVATGLQHHSWNAECCVVDADPWSSKMMTVVHVEMTQKS